MKGNSILKIDLFNLKNHIDKNFSLVVTGNSTSSLEKDTTCTIDYLLLTFYTSILILGSIGNLAVVWIMWKRRTNRKVSDFFILHLAIADLIVILINVPGEMSLHFGPEITSHFFQLLACKFVMPSMTFSIFLSVFTLVSVAYERHEAIIKPFKQRLSRKKVFLLLSCTWIASLPFIIPQALVLEYEERYCHEKWEQQYLRQIYTITIFICQYFMPLAILSVVYVKISICLHRTRLSVRASFCQELRQKQNVRICKLFSVVVFLFAVCQLPNHITWIWYDFGGRSVHTRKIFLLCYLPVLINSVLNPLSYCLLGEFRQELNHVRKKAARFLRDYMSIGNRGSFNVEHSSAEFEFRNVQVMSFLPSSTSQQIALNERC